MDQRTLNRLRQALRRDPLVILSLGWLLLITAATIGAPWISSHDPTGVEYSHALRPPSFEHLLGADNFGRDVFTRVIYGGRASLATAAISTVVIIAVSIVVGAVSGFAGGWLDIAISRVIDVLLAFPRLVLAIAIAALMGAGPVSVILAVTVVSWPGYARIFRAAVLQVKHEGYVAASRTAGTPTSKILYTHVLGAIAGPVLVLATLDLGQIILNVASLSFLGLGFTPPAPEWGAMLNEARPFVERAPWAFLAPGIATFLVVISANYLGDTVRDALDPRVPRIPSFPPLTSYLRFRRSPAANERTARLERIAVLAAGRKADDGSDGQRPIVAAVEHLDVTVLSQQHQSARDPYRSADQPILRSVSLAIREGECVGVVGESGSGKSTLAGVLMGLLRPPLAVTGGTLRLLGEDATGWAWDDWRPVRGRHVALINQDPLNALNPLLKIGDQLGECLRCHHQLPAAEVRRRVAEMLERVRLPASVANEYPHQLSGGMRQRVVIAMALICEPQLVIADEPTTALDVSTQARILDELTELQRSLGVAMIFISHDLRLVARMAERVIVMREGQIVEENTVRALFQTPQHPYTRLLISSIPGASPPMAEKELAGDARS